MLFGPGSTHLLEPVEREFGDRVGRIVGHEVGCVVDERELEPIGEPLGPTAEMTHERLGGERAVLSTEGDERRRAQSSPPVVARRDPERFGHDQPAIQCADCGVDLGAGLRRQVGVDDPPGANSVAT